MALPVVTSPVVEGDLVLDFGSATVYKPDAQTGQRRGTASATGKWHLRAVDFILRDGDSTHFVEVKDPDNSKAKPGDRRAFIESIANGTFLQEHAIAKLYGTAVGLALESMVPTGDVQYVLLVCCSDFTTPDRLALADAIARVAAVAGPPGHAWSARIDVDVIDLGEWNRRYPHMPVRRLSQP